MSYLTALVCQVYSSSKNVSKNKSISPQVGYWKEYKDIICLNKHKNNVEIPRAKKNALDTREKCCVALLPVSGNRVAGYIEGICSRALWPSSHTKDVSSCQGSAAPAEKPFPKRYIFITKYNSVLVGGWPFGDQLPLLGGAQQCAEPSCLVFGQVEGRGQYLSLIVGFPSSLFCPSAYMFAACFNLLRSYALGKDSRLAKGHAETCWGLNVTQKVWCFQPLW